MKIKQIILDNIRSYEHQEINFPEGSTLLSGDIGSGKTTVLLGNRICIIRLAARTKRFCSFEKWKKRRKSKNGF